MQWLVRTARVSIFSAPNPADWGQVNWQSITEATRETRLTPRQGVVLEEGPFGAGRLRLGYLSEPVPRADLVYLPHGLGAEDQMARARRSLGTLGDVVGEIRPLAHALLARLPRLTRIALAVDHFEQAADIDDAFQKYAQEPTFDRFQLAQARDFSYQINRRRRSEVVGALTLNRIARWSVQVWAVANVNVATGVIVSSGAPQGVDVALTTDISTGEDNQNPLDEGRLMPLFNELEALTAELATEGDVP